MPWRGPCSARTVTGQPSAQAIVSNLSRRGTRFNTNVEAGCQPSRQQPIGCGPKSNDDFRAKIRGLSRGRLIEQGAPRGRPPSNRYQVFANVSLSCGRLWRGPCSARAVTETISRQLERAVMFPTHRVPERTQSTKTSRVATPSQASFPERG